ncbi:sugar phosphate isomerase/epimerase [Defluviimonas sp. WL0002]|uniref:Sugar phosphate isomerase/epimerase n=1 Tax=Albidovulum marisflavi TaxID=2984159 RepID=A0ABT2ZGV5_9RHOB|nr:sugar phosphate isomerase/epimerase family protein [Defluviimonas sp. WL0002]MCV2870357.1 sugar phosphate isomerase/epimerase [Defluviimonas sp. WL0002]
MRDFSHDRTALSLNTATLGHNLDGHGAGWTPEQVIDGCAERGFGGIVFWRRELGNRAAEIGERVRAAGLRVDGLCRTPYLTGRDAGSDAEIQASIDMAAALGAPILTIVTGGTEPGTKGGAESRKRLADRIARHAPHASDCAVRLAIEPLNPMFGGNRTCVFTVRDALEVCGLVSMENVGIAVDVYHVWWDATLEESLEEATDHIYGYHLCDWLEDTGDMLLDRGMMGDGVADLKFIRSAVEAAGYSGPCEVEIFSARDWWLRPPGEVLDKIVDRFHTHC